MASGESGFHKGWNTFVLLVVIWVPLGMAGVEYAIRKSACGTSTGCHPLEFFAPTLLGAAIALVLPGMTLPSPMHALQHVPPRPKPWKMRPRTYFESRKSWREQTLDARRSNLLTRFWWWGKVAMAVLSAFFAMATFFSWGYALMSGDGIVSVESANIGERWGQLQTTASILYTLGAVLTLFKTGLEWYGND